MSEKYRTTDELTLRLLPEGLQLRARASETFVPRSVAPILSGPQYDDICGPGALEALQKTGWSYRWPTILTTIEDDGAVLSAAWASPIVWRKPHPLDREDGLAISIAYATASGCGGRGFATLAASASVLAILDMDERLREARVCAQMKSTNVASVQIAKKLGLRAAPHKDFSIGPFAYLGFDASTREITEGLQRNLLDRCKQGDLEAERLEIQRAG